MRSKFSLIIDNIVLFLAVGILIFSWMRFYTKSLILSALIGFFVGTLSIIILNICYKKRTKKLKLKKQEKAEIDFLNLNLPFTPKSDMQNYFYEVLSNKFETIQENEFFILKDIESLQKKSNAKQILFYPYFEKEKVDFKTLAQIIRIAKIKNLQKIIICAKDFDEEVKNIIMEIKNFEISILDTVKFYKSFAQFLPKLPQVVDISVKTLKRKELLKYAFTPSRARHYLLFGIIILLTSFLVPFKIYYLILGSILCLTAVVLKIMPFLRKEKSKK